MSVARLNMSHGSHESHKAVIDLVTAYNETGRGCVATMLDTKVGLLLLLLTVFCPIITLAVFLSATAFCMAMISHMNCWQLLCITPSLRSP